MSTPTFTVVIPTKDADATLERAVNSAHAASSETVEVIVVDDASRDHSLVQELAQRGVISLVVLDRSRGPANARNVGLRRARGHYVCFLDADDVLVANALDILRGALQHSLAAVGRFAVFDEQEHTIDGGSWEREQLHPVHRRHGRLVDATSLDAESLVTRLITPPPGGVLWQRSSVLALGGFDPRRRRSEDLELLVRASMTGTLDVTNEIVLMYRRHDAQRSAAGRARQRGRQATLAHLVLSAPDRARARSIARGVRAHHLERAERRWSAGIRSLRDAVAVTTSILLAAGFAVLGVVSVLTVRQSAAASVENLR